MSNNTMYEQIVDWVQESLDAGRVADVKKVLENVHRLCVEHAERIRVENQRANQLRYKQHLVNTANIGDMIRNHISLFVEGTFVRVTGTRDGIGIRKIDEHTPTSFIGEKYVFHRPAWVDAPRVPGWEQMKSNHISPERFVGAGILTNNLFNKVTHVWSGKEWLTVQEFINKNVNE